MKLAALVMASIAALGAQAGPAAERELTQAEDRWRARRPAAYEFTVAIAQFSLQGEFAFRVDGEASTLLSNADARQRALLEEVKSMDGLFALVRQARRIPGSRVVVTYDAALGYPADTVIDANPDMLDDNRRLRVIAFKPARVR